jgi:hypothetical protein
VADDQSPIRLSNSQLALRFDRRTGAWIGFADPRSGDELVIGAVSRTMILPPPIRRLDTQAIHQAVVSQKALDVDGDWLHTPTPPSPSAAARYVQGCFDEGKWEPTTIPSRRGAGDDRLHNRVGEFFYRREFTCPPHWPDEEMALVIGAVDDFDSTYVNGTEIGTTGVEMPHHWETARIYRFPARLLHQGRPNTLLVKVTNAAYDGGIDGPVVVGPASALDAVEIGGSRLVDLVETREGQAAVLKMTIRSEEYEYRMDYFLPDGQPWFARQLTVRNVGAGQKVLQSIQAERPLNVAMTPYQIRVLVRSVPQ